MNTDKGKTRIDAEAKRKLILASRGLVPRMSEVVPAMPEVVPAMPEVVPAMPEVVPAMSDDLPAMMGMLPETSKMPKIKLFTSPPPSDGQKMTVWVTRSSGRGELVSAIHFGTNDWGELARLACKIGRRARTIG